MLIWAHCGDLHVSHEDAYISIPRLGTLVRESNRHLNSSVDFIFLPGGNANNGTAEQYRRIGDMLSDLTLPIHAIPSDHDFEPSTLDAFYPK
jgi:3',5'-cyclic-AMP phosphodiesterase